MPVKKGQLYKFRISKIAFGGKGIAKIDGFTVFVDNAVPFDLVDARIIKKKKNYAIARVDRIIEPSPFRIKPLCEYSGFCGGCKWQFLKYSKQLEYKREFVADSLKHIGGFKEVCVHPAIPSGQIFGYRNKMEFSCSDRKWLSPEEMNNDNVDRDFALGLHVPGTYYKVLDTKACLLQPQTGNRILGDVRDYIKNSTTPVYGLRSHSGFWRFLMLRHSAAYNRWMVNIVTAAEDLREIEPLSGLLMDRYPEIVSVINNVTSRKAGVATGEYEIQIGGCASIRDKIGHFEFEISANSFFQTNTKGAERLYNIVKKYANLSGKETVLDLYSGTGTIAIYLSGSAREVIGFEIVESAVADAEKNCLKNNISNCRFILGDIRQSMTRLDIKPDVMIIDPPRAGMHKDVVREVIKMSPDRIVYVSCNPAAMARDLSMIKEIYKVSEIQPVDMFPHTYHIESVARIEKNK